MNKRFNSMDDLVLLSFVVACFVTAAIVAMIILSFGGVPMLIAAFIGGIIGYFVGQLFPKGDFG